MAIPMRCNPEDSISESNAAAAHPRLGHPRQGSEVIYGYISVESDSNAMPSPTSLSGLMKWLRRDPWSGAFSDLLEHHLGPACTKAGIEIGELADIIGNDGAATLWGCAFEDFLTREPSEVGNIVEDYLKRRGWNEKAQNKAYMIGLRSSVMGIYEVSDVKSGESFMARDLFRDGEPVRISERTANSDTEAMGPDRCAGRGGAGQDHHWRRRAAI